MQCVASRQHIGCLPKRQKELVIQDTTILNEETKVLTSLQILKISIGKTHHLN